MYDPKYARLVAQRMDRIPAEKLFFNELNVDQASLDNLHKNENHQRLYIGNHISHADYALAWILFHRQGIKMPMIPAGENLNLKIFKLLHLDFGKLCGFFVDRDLIDSNGHGSFSHRKNLCRSIKYMANQGESFFPFPDGGRDYEDRTLARFKSGIIEILIKQDIPLDLVNVAFHYDNRVEEQYFSLLSKFKELKIEAKKRGNNVAASIYEAAYLACDGLSFLTRPLVKEFSDVGKAHIRIDEPIPLIEVVGASKSLDEKVCALRDFSKKRICEMRSSC